jgi:succinoglycan biosynthesis transport protein ExoP
MRRGHAASGDGVVSGVNLARVGEVLLERRWRLIGPTLAAFIGALLFVSIVAPRYSAQTRLLLESQERVLTRAGKSKRIDQSQPDAHNVQSSVQLLTSHDLARRVIKSLGLGDADEFNSLAHGQSVLSRVMMALRVIRDPTLVAPEERILERFSERLAIRTSVHSPALSIEFWSRDADLAARSANAVAEAFIEMQQEANRAKAHASAQTLAAVVADLKTQVADAEARVEAFRALSPSLTESNDAGISPQNVGDLNAELSAARRTARADPQAKAEMLREMLRQGRIDAIVDVADDEPLRRLYLRRAELRAQLAFESRTLLWKHPLIKELSAQLADVDGQLRLAAERTARALEKAAREQAEISRRSEDRDGAPMTEGDALALERAAKLLKQQLQTETANYQQALAREGQKAARADARIVRRAAPARLPLLSRTFAIAGFATLCAFLLAAGEIIFSQMLHGSRDSTQTGGSATGRSSSRATAIEGAGSCSRPTISRVWD